MAERSAVRNYSTIEEGRLQVELDAETRCLLGVWLEEERGQGRIPRGKGYIRVGLNSALRCSYMDIIGPWLRAWCKRPEQMARVRLERGTENRGRLDVRATQPEHMELCRIFAACLRERQASASDVLRGLITAKVKERRAELVVVERDMQATAARKARTQRQREWRRKSDTTLSEVINDFLAAVGTSYTRRNRAQMLSDDEALKRLAAWTRDTYIAVTRRIKTAQKLSDAEETALKRALAEEFIRPLGFALPRPDVTTKRAPG